MISVHYLLNPFKSSDGVGVDLGLQPGSHAHSGHRHVSVRETEAALLCASGGRRLTSS